MTGKEHTISPSVQELRASIAARLAELRPLVHELQQLEAALAAIDSIPEPPTPVIPSEAHKGMRLPKEQRKKQVIALLLDRGQMRIGELAAALDLTSPRTVQLANELESGGILTRTPEGLQLTGRGLREGLGISVETRPVGGGSG